MAARPPGSARAGSTRSPVPAGISRPIVTFSFRPRRWSTLPEIDASVSTRVVSWNDAAEMNESVESDAFVIPSSSGRPVRRTSARGNHALVLFHEPEAIDLLLDQELGVADILDLHPPHHLPDDDLDVLVVDVDALQPVDLLDFVDEIRVQRLLAEDRQDVVRVARPVHQRLARPDAVAFLDVDVHAARQRVLSRLAARPRGTMMILRCPLTMPPCRTMPSISEMTAVSRGFRASNSSTTRGRPPVMSLVLVVSRGIFASTWPA